MRLGLTPLDPLGIGGDRAAAGGVEGEIAEMHNKYAQFFERRKTCRFLSGFRLEIIGGPSNLSQLLHGWGEIICKRRNM